MHEAQHKETEKRGDVIPTRQLDSLVVDVLKGRRANAVYSDARTPEEIVGPSALK